ncbi:succinate dehydrogenase, hydrophobic membrane anchor protein [Aurantiacibacter arachoides]|nr:succinate dehydrogenase, hydrophobic membrane anchor protein [Aurantiacibacter arachoides]
MRGLGSSHHGSHHWLLQRFTAVGNLVTVLFLIVSLLLLPDLSHATVTGWLSGPLPALMVALMIVSTFWHARLGLQVLIEDYVHAIGNRFAVILALNLFTIVGAVAALFFLFLIVTGAGAPAPVAPAAAGGM